MRLEQPDGVSFTAIFTGDEFARIKTTSLGHAIMQDKDGWWYYAVYGNDGTMSSSGWKVGGDVPEDILSASLDIPRSIISDRAKSVHRDAAIMNGKPLYGRQSEIATRSHTGARHGIVILAEFEDIRFTHTKEDFEALLSQPGYNRNGATGSAKEYFDDQFGGLLEFDFDVSDIVTLKGKREFYGGNNSSGNDSRPADFIIDACTIADEQVDFSLYDDDGDGVVDNVFVFFAGEDEAEGGDEGCIWSHAWYIRSGAQKTLQLDGCLIDRYACTSEITRIYDGSGRLEETRLSGIGTFCHEYSHTFGLPDMYDTDYDNKDGWAAGLWNTTSLMDAGNQNNNGNTPPNFNALEREMLGISSPVVISCDGAYGMSPVNISGECFRMETDTEDEYYIFECRSTDQKWDAHIGGSGMLVYHVDKTERMADRWTIHNTVNSDASHQCADLVEADGRIDSFSSTEDFLSRKGNTTGIFFPYNDINHISPSGNPGLGFWSGSEGKFTVTGIRKDDGGRVYFNIIGGSEQTTPPSVKGSIGYDVFCDGAIVSFESSREFEGTAKLSYGLTGQDTTTVTLMPYEPGKYAAYLKGLLPTRTYTVSVAFETGGVQGKVKSTSFMTKKAPVVGWPYMHFGNARRNIDGTFPQGARIPLKVINAGDAAQIIWTFDDREIHADGDFYYELESSGTLKAHIIWNNGSEDLVVKEITIIP